MDGLYNRSSGNEVNMLRNYKIGKTLGIGSFGKVKLAEHVLTGHTVAIKILNRQIIKNTNMEEKVSREIEIMRLLIHPHIVRLYEVIETPTDIYVVMEHMMHGELFDYIVQRGRLREDEARKFFQQIISGIEFCHGNKVIHRDLKPENLLLDSKGNVKIADFGLSNIMRDGHFLKTSCGSPDYAAPEVISGKWYGGPEVDVWSSGIILYALLCGRLPFEDENMSNLFKKIKRGHFSLPSHLSDGAKDLIPKLVNVDAMKRLTIPEIRKHQWFQAHLPRHLAVPLPDTLRQAKQISEGIFHKVVNLGFDLFQLKECLLNRIQNEATVSYYLLLDNQPHASTGNLEARIQETEEHVYDSFHQMSPGGEHPVMMEWELGLQFQANPRDLMAKILRALQELNVLWKKIGHYNLKCRWVPTPSTPDPGDHYTGDASSIIKYDSVFASPNVVMFEIQLYKTQDKKYLVDFQRVQGPQFLYFNLISAFLAQLQYSGFGFEDNLSDMRVDA